MINLFYCISFKNYILHSIQIIQNHQQMWLTDGLKYILTNLLCRMLLGKKNWDRESKKEWHAGLKFTFFLSFLEVFITIVRKYTF